MLGRERGNGSRNAADSSCRVSRLRVFVTGELDGAELPGVKGLDAAGAGFVDGCAAGPIRFEVEVLAALFSGLMAEVARLNSTTAKRCPHLAHLACRPSAV